MFSNQEIKFLVSLFQINILLKYAKNFIPTIDNWAVNDIFCQNFKIAKKNQAKTYQFLLKYTNEQETT